jgi:hypothetical protein
MALACSPRYSFSVSWLGVQSADVSALQGVKHVSSLSAKPLDHRAHMLCGCVPVSILDLLHFMLLIIAVMTGTHHYLHFLAEMESGKLFAQTGLKSSSF